MFLLLYIFIAHILFRFLVPPTYHTTIYRLNVLSVLFCSFKICFLFCVFPFIGTSQYMFVEFMSSPAGPLLNTGFHFNVGNWPGHVDTAGVKSGACDWLLSSDALRDSNGSEGIFLSIAHWYPPNTSCSYLIQGNEGEVVRLYFPR